MHKSMHASYRLLCINSCIIAGPLLKYDKTSYIPFRFLLRFLAKRVQLQG